MLSNLLIDLPNFTPFDMSELEDFVLAKQREIERRHRWEFLLEHGSDREIVDQARRDCENQKSPIVTADTYAHGLDWKHNIVREAGRSPRRPVYMMGGRERMVRIYSLSASDSPLGLREAAFQRYVKITKPTVLDGEEAEAFIQGINERSNKFRKWVRDENESFLFYQYQDSDSVIVTIKGKRSRLTLSEYENVKRMYEIIRRTESLDERIKAVLSTSRTVHKNRNRMIAAAMATSELSLVPAHEVQA